MSEEIKTELNEDETVWPPYRTDPLIKPTLKPTPKTNAHANELLPFFKEDDFKVTSEFDDTRQEDDTDGLEDLERVSSNISARFCLFENPPNLTNSVALLADLLNRLSASCEAEFVSGGGAFKYVHACPDYSGQTVPI